MSLVLLLITASCNSDDLVTMDNRVSIVFDANINDKTTRDTYTANFKTTFSDNDEVGIYAVKRPANSSNTATLQPSGNYIHNARLTYSAADGGKWTPDIPLYHAGDNYVLDLYAYYPYDAAATNPTAIDFLVKLDQSMADNYVKSDLMSASATGISKGEPVNLLFAHRLAMMQVDVNPSGINPNDVPIITLRDFFAGATLDLRDGGIETTGSSMNITMFRIEQQGDADYGSKYTYSAIVPTQIVPGGARLAIISYGDKEFITPSLYDTIILYAGSAGVYKIALN